MLKQVEVLMIDEEINVQQVEEEQQEVEVKEEQNNSNHKQQQEEEELKVLKQFPAQNQVEENNYIYNSRKFIR